MECIHACPRFVPLGVTVYSNALLYVSLFLLLTDLRQYSSYKQEELSPRPPRDYGRPEPWGEGHGHPSLQDADPQQRDSTGQRQHEGWVPFQNASIRAGQIILHLHASQELLKAR